MREDYLWDRSGPPDPEIAALEEALGRFAADAGRRTRRAALLRAAAILLVAVGVGIFLFTRGGKAAPASSSYDLLVVEGTAHLTAGDGTVALDAGSRPQAVPRGGRVRVPPGAVIELVAEGIGTVTAGSPEAEAVLSVVEAGEERHLLRLERGRLRALISANVRPRLFQIGTPAGTAVDLGCAYELDVAADGATVLSVTLGCVTFETARGAVWVTSGHALSAPPGRPLGLPVAEDAAPAFRAALAAWEADPTVALAALLETARPGDALTLWHLIPADRPPPAALFERLSALAPPAPGLLPGLRAGAPEARAAWRRQITGGW